MSNQIENNTIGLEELLTVANTLPRKKRIQDNKTIIPSTSVQTIQPDNGYDGFGQVIVDAIPDDYINVDLNVITAKEEYVRLGDVFVDINGDKKIGTLRTDMVALGPNSNGIPTAVPASVITQDPFNTGTSYLSVGTNFGTADAGQVLEGYTFTTDNFFSNDWNHFELTAQGTMPNNGDTSKTIDGLETKTASIPAGYTSGGTISVSNKIDNLAATQANLLNNISNSLNDKVVVDTITVQRVDGSFKAGSTQDGEWAGVSLPWQPDILILYLDGYKDQINTNKYGRIESNIIFNLSESNSFYNDFINYDSNYLRRMESVGRSEIAGGLIGVTLDFDTSNNVAEIQCYTMTDSINSWQIITDDWNAIFHYRAIKYT